LFRLLGGGPFGGGAPPVWWPRGFAPFRPKVKKSAGAVKGGAGGFITGGGRSGGGTQGGPWARLGGGGRGLSFGRFSAKRGPERLAARISAPKKKRGRKEGPWGRAAFSRSRKKKTGSNSTAGATARGVAGGPGGGVGGLGEVETNPGKFSGRKIGTHLIFRACKSCGGEHRAGTRVRQASWPILYVIGPANWQRGPGGPLLGHVASFFGFWGADNQGGKGFGVAGSRGGARCGGTGGGSAGFGWKKNTCPGGGFLSVSGEPPLHIPRIFPRVGRQGGTRIARNVAGFAFWPSVLQGDKGEFMGFGLGPLENQANFRGDGGPSFFFRGIGR